VVIVAESRFRRVTDDVVDEPSESVIEAVAVETPSKSRHHDEEDLSVGPGNEAGKETHDPLAVQAPKTTRRPRRSGARAPKAAAPVARTRRPPRARKPKA
jgi:hypothetical protein